MYEDFKGAFNPADHRIMFKHMRHIGMPSTFVDTCKQLYGVSTTDGYITPHGPTPSIDINRGTLRHTPSPPSSSPSSSNHSYAGSRSVAEATAPVPPPLTPTPQNPRRPTHATDSLTTSVSQRAPTNMTIQLQKLSLFSAYTCMTVNVRKCCITGTLWSKGNALSLANRTFLAPRLQSHFVTINT
jgi:hypothetical protein